MGIREKNKNLTFFPREIIFSPSASCNLNCSHCFVSRNNSKLDAEDAISFLKSCQNSPSCEISKVGFSGGETFLSLQFLKKVIAFASENGFFFDRIMTNGVWWKNEEEISSALCEIKDAGFDGKIGLSLDLFHSNVIEKTCKFCQKAFETWNDGSIIEIQSVVPEGKPSSFFTKEILLPFSRMMDLKIKTKPKIKRGSGFSSLFSDDVFIPFRVSPVAFPSSDKRSWEAKKWFFDDFCSSLGQILYVHPDGNLAPCCGFANENQCLIIGNIKMSYSDVMKSAKENKMIHLCFEEGLSSVRSRMQKDKIPFPFLGKTDDPCSFCSFIMNEKINSTFF